MPQAFHELSKEPNNHILFEATLKFMGERVTGKAGAAAQPFGAFKPDIVKYYSPVKKRKFWRYLIVLAYLIIGFIFARKFNLKRKILTWPLAFLKR